MRWAPSKGVLYPWQELGDIQNWAQMIENDMKAISLTLEEIHKASAAGRP
jgi:hypothetical protein